MKSLRSAMRFHSSDRDDEARRGGCRHTRQWFLSALRRGLGPEAGWVQRHMAACPRCCRRAASWRRVELGLRVVKSRPLRLGLLQQANAEAVKMLTHELREAAKARELTSAEAESPFLGRAGRHRHWLTNIAACLAILFLTRSGLFSSLNRLNTGGEAYVRHYYASQAGEDLAGEVFDS